MTDKEIIELVEYYKETADEITIAKLSFDEMSNILDLINRQQKQLDNYSHNVRNMAKDFIEQQKIIYRQQAEIERLKKGWKADVIETENIKSEAIKEFANEFEYEILHKEFWNDHPHTSQVWINGYEQCMRDMRVMLKDKLKEMMGEDK